jgi:hypothetical protein
MFACDLSAIGYHKGVDVVVELERAVLNNKDIVGRWTKR